MCAFLQLQLAELEKEQLRAALAKQQEEVERLVRGHREELHQAKQEKVRVRSGLLNCLLSDGVLKAPPSLHLYLHDLCQTQEELVLQLMEQTTALDEDKTRLSKIVCELKAEREGHLKLIEELAVKACQ